MNGEERMWEIWNFFIQIHHFFSIRIGMKMGEEVTLKRKLQIYPSTIMLQNYNIIKHNSNLLSILLPFFLPPYTKHTW